MPAVRRVNMADPDEFDILSAIWILASNDENSLLTYKGITVRLDLPDDYDVKRLIRFRGELFRRGVRPQHLEKWKEDMRAGKHLPSWMFILQLEERSREIDSLSTHDIFRSQFRTGQGAPKSPIEIIDWGLKHIDRLRHASFQAREGNAKSWQMWVVAGISLINIVVTVVLTFLYPK
ncbi:MAG TPA: hypothetical protein VJ183_07635 [Chloroflexia bacterium]|nr:hypothetical protein [Chloroflexia bacterium]